jgi:5S rRNA maturation endonuclease (ribonuclease M5)
LSTRMKEKQEKIRQIIVQLAAESAEGTLILVEGKKDLEALRSLGVAGPILAVKSGGKSFLQTISEIKLSGVCRVVLLMDFDRRGRQGTVRLKEGLERLKIKSELSFWRSLHALVGRDVQCIEGLVSYMQTLEAKAGGL